MIHRICFAPPGGATSLLLGVSSFGLVVSLFGVILTQYKAQFYVESDVTKGLYFGAAIFFWMVFVFSLTLICFSMMQRKHLQHVSADYPEIDLRTGRKGKFLLGSLILACLGTAGGFGFGGFGVHYMESRKTTTLQWAIDDGVDLDGDGNLLQLSIEQTVQGAPKTWKDVQDRLGCCSWSNTTDTHATGYCCLNADHECPVDDPVPCRELWLDEMATFNLQVCVLLLAVGCLQALSAAALLQLRCLSRSSLYLYSAYGGSLSEKRAREKKAAAAAAKAAEEAAAKAQVLGELADSPGGGGGGGDDEDEREGDEAEKQPLTGGNSGGGSGPGGGGIGNGGGAGDRDGAAAVPVTVQG